MGLDISIYTSKGLPPERILSKEWAKWIHTLDEVYYSHGYWDLYEYMHAIKGVKNRSYAEISKQELYELYKIVSYTDDALGAFSLLTLYQRYDAFVARGYKILFYCSWQS